jgi:hypothetical protein
MHVDEMLGLADPDEKARGEKAAATHQHGIAVHQLG